jgi:hypothetical protein
MKLYYFFISIILISKITLAQLFDDPLKYFPYKTGDMWEYYWDDSQYPDTLQNFNIKDSVDAEGNIYVTQSARFINPIKPPALLSDTAIYKIDTSFNVFCLTCPIENQYLYKLNAQQGDQWVAHIYQDSSNVYGYEMVRVERVWEDELFFGSGIYSTFKAFVYYYAPDSTDTLGLTRYGTVLTKNFGLWSKGGGDAVGDIFLKGCVINDTLYGDTTNVITSVKDLSENLPVDFELYPNFPNPFNPKTTISFKIKSSQIISLIVYDMMGKEVKRLIDNEYYYSGIYKKDWNSKNNSNQLVSSGVYYYRLISGSVNSTRSMILMK